jgi:hypothetical protein
VRHCISTAFCTRPSSVALIVALADSLASGTSTLLSGRGAFLSRVLFDGLVVNCLFIPHEEADEALRETDGLLALTEDHHAEGDLGETVMAALTEAGELVGVVCVAAS